jgi:hypothetical protein
MASSTTKPAVAKTATVPATPRRGSLAPPPSAIGARKAAHEAETQARIDELTKKFEEQRAELEAKIVGDKQALEARIAEVTEEGAKKLDEEKTALESKIAELTAQSAHLEER